MDANLKNHGRFIIPGQALGSQALLGEAFLAVRAF